MVIVYSSVNLRRLLFDKSNFGLSMEEVVRVSVLFLSNQLFFLLSTHSRRLAIQAIFTKLGFEQHELLSLVIAQQLQTGR